MEALERTDLWLALFLISSAVARGFKCPKQDGYFGDVSDCRRYYLCLNNKAYLDRCPTGSLFDSITGKCTRTGSALCTESTVFGNTTLSNGGETVVSRDSLTVQSSTQETSGPSTPFRCPEKNRYLPHPDDCRRFYLCYNWVAYLDVCPRGKLFDETMRRCLSAQQVRCHRPSQTSNETSTTSQSSSTSVATEQSTTSTTSTHEPPTTTVIQPSTTIIPTEPTTTTQQTLPPNTLDSMTTTQESSTTTTTQAPVVIIIPDTTTTTQEPSQTTPVQPSTTIITSDATTTTQPSTPTQELSTTTTTQAPIIIITPDTTTTIQPPPTTTAVQSSTTIITQSPPTNISSDDTTSTTTIQPPISMVQESSTTTTPEPPTTNSTPSATTTMLQFSTTTAQPSSTTTAQEPATTKQEPSTTTKTESPNLINTIELSTTRQKSSNYSTVLNATVFTRIITLPPAETSSKTFIPEVETNDVDDHDEEEQCPEWEGLFPHPQDKSKYLICQVNYAYVLQCPEGLVFDPEAKLCVWRPAQDPS